MLTTVAQARLTGQNSENLQRPAAAGRTAEPRFTVRFLMANREIATILVGASTREEIEESVVAAQAGPLPPDLHQTLQALT